MAWHDLIAQLGTLTINEVALPLGERQYNPDACPPNGPAGTGLRSARRAAPSCPVADRPSEKEGESDQAVTRVPSEKFGLDRRFTADADAQSRD